MIYTNNMNTTEKKWYYPYGCTSLHELNGGYYESWEDFAFKCNYRSNRNGFVHEWELYFRGSYVGEYKIQYYNRTRERFCYESLMKNLLIDFLYTKDWRFLEENKKEILMLCKDLWLYFGEVLRKTYKMY